MAQCTLEFCQTDHTYVCECGHAHDEHLAFVGCTVLIVTDGNLNRCECVRYDQSKQRKPRARKERRVAKSASTVH